MSKADNRAEWPVWEQRMHEIVFEADTPKGKLFDIVLLIAIMLSICAVMAETVPELNERYHWQLVALEWTFTIIFTIEYILRIVIVRKPWGYIRSFYGIIDLLSILPTYLAFFLVGAQTLMVLRILRLFRIFRLFKLGRYVSGGMQIAKALKSSREKIVVFIFVVLIIASITGTLMYLIEGASNGFDSIPRGIYWAIVTMTTLGYGDITPSTTLGQVFTVILVLVGYGIIAVPTGIVAGGYTNVRKTKLNTQVCPSCSKEGHEEGAVYCFRCGSELD